MSKTVLVVDDEKIMLSLFSRMLTTSGYQVLTAESGAEALQILGSNQVGLVFTDVNMPGGDGISLISKIRQHPNGRNTPIIMVTTESQMEKKNQAKAAGANGWLQKPIKMSNLVSIAQRLLG
jgi:two-component system chemotaxis response regulator CheY